MEPLPAGQALRHGMAEEIGRDPVVVSPVRRTAVPLQHPALLQQPGVGADAALAHPELCGQVVEGAAVFAQEQQTEDAAGNAGKAVGLERQTHPFDEVHRLCVHGSPHSELRRRAGGKVNSVQYQLNAAALRCPRAQARSRATMWRTGWSGSSCRRPGEGLPEYEPSAHPGNGRALVSSAVNGGLTRPVESARFGGSWPGCCRASGSRYRPPCHP